MGEPEEVRFLNLQVRLTAAFLVFFFAVSLVTMNHVSNSSVSENETVSAANELWLGAGITNLGWEPYGNLTYEEQFDLLKESGANTVRVYLNYWAWTHDPTDNSLKIPYREFLDKVADWCYVRGIKVVWSAHVFSRWGGNWGFDAKRAFLMDEQVGMPNINNDSENWSGEWESSNTLSWDDYVQWVVEIASRPKMREVAAAVDIFNEPPWADDWENRGPHQQQLEDKYLEFMRKAIDAVREVAPDVKVVVEGIPFWFPGFFLFKPLERANVVYALHWYCWCEDPYANGWPSTLIARAYAEGRFDEGKEFMIKYFYGKDVGFFALQDKGYSVLFTEVGTDTLKQEAYWSKWMQDFYNICKDRRIGFTQHSFFYTKPPISVGETPSWCIFGMLGSNYSVLDVEGQLWKENVQDS